MKNLSGKHLVRKKVLGGEWSKWEEDNSRTPVSRINEVLKQNGYKPATPKRVSGGVIAWEYGNDGGGTNVGGRESGQTTSLGRNWL